MVLQTWDLFIHSRDIHQTSITQHCSMYCSVTLDIPGSYSELRKTNSTDLLNMAETIWILALPLSCFMTLDRPLLAELQFSHSLTVPGNIYCHRMIGKDWMWQAKWSRELLYELWSLPVHLPGQASQRAA